MKSPVMLTDLLRPYRTDAVADAVGVHAKTVRLWNTRKTSPAVDKIPALAAFLHIDMAIVVNAIANQKTAT
jgi:hypothetical protein